jgi:ketosteroid isomerase-like protein
MSAIAETHKGEKLDMTYCHILKFNENQIIEVHEFFDTAQGERLFSNDKLNGHSGKLGPMNY